MDSYGIIRKTKETTTTTTYILQTKTKKQKDRRLPHLFLNGMALITTTWYNAASAAPMKGPTQNTHCIPTNTKRTNLYQNIIHMILYLNQHLYKRRWNTYVIIPCVVLVKNNGSSQAPCRVNSSSGDRNGGQVHQKHGEPNWQRRQYLKNQHKTHFQIVVFIRRLVI